MVFREQVWVSGFECFHLSTQQSNACRPHLYATFIPRRIQGNRGQTDGWTHTHTHTHTSWAAVVSQHHHSLCNWCYPGRTVVAPGPERGGRIRTAAVPVLHLHGRTQHSGLIGSVPVSFRMEQVMKRSRGSSLMAAGQLLKSQPLLSLQGRPERKP